MSGDAPSLGLETVPSPFDKGSDGDIVFKTSDGVHFFIHKVILAEASPFFADMFSLPQPQTDSDVPASPSADASVPTKSFTVSQKHTISGLPIITITELSTTLEPLLRMCYPMADPGPATLGELPLLIDAARKYELSWPMAQLKRQLVAAADSAPLAAYAIAIRFRLLDEARVAARSFLYHQAPWPYVGELEYITGGAYYRLLEYRERCVAAAIDVPEGDLQWFTTMDANAPICFWTGTPCQCPQHGPSTRRVAPIITTKYMKPWFTSYLNEVSSMLRGNPCDGPLKQPTIMDSVLLAAVACSSCRIHAIGQLRDFTMKMAAEVDRRVSEVSHLLRTALSLDSYTSCYRSDWSLRQITMDNENTVRRALCTSTIVTGLDLTATG